jgi:hypothetical protein
VRRSWFADLDAEDIRGEIAEFSAIWDPQLLILPLPEAVRRYLDHFQHYFELGEQDPPRDPLDVAAVHEMPLIDPQSGAVAARCTEAAGKCAPDP